MSRRSRDCIQKRNVSAFASDAIQLEISSRAEAQLQGQIAAGNPIGPPPLGRHTFRVELPGAAFSYSIEGATVDGAGNLVGGRMVETQIDHATVVYHPRRMPPPAMTPADYYIVTMFPGP